MPDVNRSKLYPHIYYCSLKMSARCKLVTLNTVVKYFGINSEVSCVYVQITKKSKELYRKEKTDLFCSP